MNFLPAIRLVPLLLLAFLPMAGAAPVIEGLPAGAGAEVPANIPVGKALVLPVSVYDDAAAETAPTITVTSSNPNIFARVRTGNPLLKMSISHSGTPAYSGDLVFQLFNDWTPVATGFIAGFAQAGFYDNLIFHRLANLHGADEPDEYIYQGGDPLGGVVATAGQGGPGFKYDNEPVASLIFKGRGQLALANSSYTSVFKGSNGSQFFITDDPARDLDFGYTIFGQLTHGWDLLDSLRATPVQTGTDSNGDSLVNRPVTAVTITSASIGTRYLGKGADNQDHLFTDAVLLLSAKREGTATITVTCGATVSTFIATATKDTFNDPPYFVPLPDFMTKGQKVNVPFRVVDLEYDYVQAGGTFVNNFSSVTGDQKAGFTTSTVPGTFGLQGNPKFTATVGGTAFPYVGTIQPVFQATQWHPSYRPGYDDAVPSVDRYYAPNVAIGVSPVVGESVIVTGAPATALTSTVVARFTNSDRQAAPARVTALINWGDGKLSSNNTLVDTAGTVAFSSAPGGFHEFTVAGTHTYARAGIYTILTTLTGDTGWTKEVRSTAVITPNALVATPLPVTVKGAKAINIPLATFTDSQSPGPVSAYTATVDWGDGVVAPATVRAFRGAYLVQGSHLYRDPETFSMTVRIHKEGRTADQDAVIWNRAVVTGFAAPQHLPPFNQAHVSTMLGEVPLFSDGTNTFYKELKLVTGNVEGQSQTYLTVQLQIRNSGNLIARPSTLRIYLSRDTTLNKTAVRDAQGNVVEPADIPLEFGPDLRNGAGVLSPQSQVGVQALLPGQSITYLFQKSDLGDYRLRLPANETGTGYNIIADLQNSDPLVPLEPVGPAILGRLQGINVSANRLNTSETGTSATFTVSLDRKPRADVVIPLTGDATEGTISPASLTFTPTNWHTPQTVTVTGVPDSALPPNNTNTDQAVASYFLTLNAAESADPLYDGLIGPVVSVINADRDSFLGVGAVAGNQTVATGSSTTVATTAASGTSNIATITLTLKRKPTAPVTVSISIGDTANGQIVTEGGISPENPTVTFQPTDFDTTSLRTRTFHIKGLQDPAATGTGKVSYAIGFQAASEDSAFGGITPTPVTVSNQNAVTTPTTP